MQTDEADGLVGTGFRRYLLQKRLKSDHPRPTRRLLTQFKVDTGTHYLSRSPVHLRWKEAKALCRHSKSLALWQALRIAATLRNFGGWKGMEGVRQLVLVICLRQM
jgi:hypothetical protein